MILIIFDQGFSSCLSKSVVVQVQERRRNDELLMTARKREISNLDQLCIPMQAIDQK